MTGKILVPVDFSNHTMVSCRYAIYLAKSTGKDIILFHSFFDQIYFSDGGFATGFESGIMLTDEIILDFYKKKEIRLNEIAMEMRDTLKSHGSPAITVDCQMESGNPEVQILNAISRTEPDMIVMGSSGIGKKSLLSGSVARRIMDHTSTPVFAIPNIENLPEISQVGYMTNFDPADPDVITGMETLLSSLKIQVHCLHICQPGKETEAKAGMEKLSVKSSTHGKSPSMQFHVKPGHDPNEILQDFIKENRISILAFIPHKRNVFRSFNRQNLTKDDLFLTNIPILAIPARS